MSRILVVTREDIAHDLKQLGLRAGDKVLVHSSLSSLGEVNGGADSLIDALLDAVSPGGTIVLPTLTGSQDDSPERPPCFDVRNTPTWCGLVPETARQRSEAVRSLHPTHSVVAIGPDAKRLTSGHETARTPCGWDSPYGKLAQAGGRILLIGVNHDRNTTFHSAEEIAGMPYLFQPEPVLTRVIDPSGKNLAVRTLFHKWDVPRDFERWNHALREAGIMIQGRVRGAEVRLMESKELILFLVKVLARDPCAFLQQPL